MKIDQKFSYRNKLKNSKEISRLFKAGNFLFSGSFKIIWDIFPIESGKEFKVAVSVPKKRLKRAVDRNKTKRHFREIFRKKKYLMEIPEKFELRIFFIYQKNFVSDFSQTETEIENIFLKLNFSLSKSQNHLNEHDLIEV